MRLARRLAAERLSLLEPFEFREPVASVMGRSSDER